MEQLIPSANSVHYTVQSAGYALRGTYRVSVDCGNNTSYATLAVNNDYAVSFATLHITPDSTGTWTYQWWVATDLAGPYIQHHDESDPMLLESDPSLILFMHHRGVAPSVGTRYYKGIATRSGGGSAYVVASQFAGYGAYRIATKLEEKSLASLDVTYTAGLATVEGPYQWYFTPASGPSAGIEQTLFGETASQYTIPSVCCDDWGTYRLDAGRSFAYPMGSEIDLDVADCPP